MKELRVQKMLTFLSIMLFLLPACGQEIKNNENLSVTTNKINV